MKLISRQVMKSQVKILFMFMSHIILYARRTRKNGVELKSRDKKCKISGSGKRALYSDLLKAYRKRTLNRSGFPIERTLKSSSMVTPHRRGWEGGTIQLGECL